LKSKSTNNEIKKHSMTPDIKSPMNYRGMNKIMNQDKFFYTQKKNNKETIIDLDLLDDINFDQPFGSDMKNRQEKALTQISAKDSDATTLKNTRGKSQMKAEND